MPTHSVIQRLLFDLVLLTTLSTAFSLLESIPPHVDGILTAYHGDQISLTCSHDNPATAVTKWSFSSPVNCDKAIDHNPPISTTSVCGPFMFVGISGLSCCHLNSTAVATASTSITGAVVECRDSAGLSPTVVGSITLCIIDLPQPPSSISWSMETASIMWSPVPQAACSMKNLSYSVSIIPLPLDSDTFSTEANKTYLPSVHFNTTYIVLISTRIKADQLQSDTVSTLLFTTPPHEGNTFTPQTLPTTSLESGITYQTSSVTSMPCSCHNLMINTSESNTCTTSTGRLDLAIIISVPVAIFLTLCIGLIVGSLITYCIMKTCASPILEYNSNVPQRPIYEEISPSSGIHSEIIELEENVAYGPAGK